VQREEQKKIDARSKEKIGKRKGWGGNRHTELYKINTIVHSTVRWMASDSRNTKTNKYKILHEAANDLQK
jgi:hypothetical protein